MFFIFNFNLNFKESQKEAELAEQKKSHRADKKKDAKNKQQFQQRVSKAANPVPVAASSEIRPYKSKSSQAPLSTTTQSLPDQPVTGAVYVRGQKRKVQS